MKNVSSEARVVDLGVRDKRDIVGELAVLFEEELRRHNVSLIKGNELPVKFHCKLLSAQTLTVDSIDVQPALRYL